MRQTRRGATWKWPQLRTRTRCRTPAGRAGPDSGGEARFRWAGVSAGQADAACWRSTGT